MSTDVTVRQTADLTEKIEWSRALAPASLLPKQYQGNPANLLFAVEYADALGIERINAITSIHVIEGKPSASAELIAGLIRRAGHRLRITGDDTTATAQIIRADDPEFVYEATWTLDRARTAGLAGKAVWKNYPAAMLRARAITEVARMGASDALLGVVYTPEELGAEVGVDGLPVKPVAISAPPSGPDRMRAALHPDAPAEDVQDAEVVEPAPVDAWERDADALPDPLTDRTRKQMFAELTKHGITDAATQRAGMSKILGREIKSRADLTEDDGRTVILDLMGRPVPTVPDDAAEGDPS